MTGCSVKCNTFIAHCSWSVLPFDSHRYLLCRHLKHSAIYAVTLRQRGKYDYHCPMCANIHTVLYRGTQHTDCAIALGEEDMQVVNWTECTAGSAGSAGTAGGVNFVQAREFGVTTVNLLWDVIRVCRQRKVEEVTGDWRKLGNSKLHIGAIHVVCCLGMWEERRGRLPW